MGSAAVASPREGGGTPMVGTCPAAISEVRVSRCAHNDHRIPCMALYWSGEMCSNPLGAISQHLEGLEPRRGK